MLFFRTGHQYQSAAARNSSDTCCASNFADCIKKDGGTVSGMVVGTVRDLLKGLSLTLWNLVKLLVILVVLARIGIAVMNRGGSEDGNSS